MGTVYFPVDANAAACGGPVVSTSVAQVRMGSGMAGTQHPISPPVENLGEKLGEAGKPLGSG